MKPFATTLALLIHLSLTYATTQSPLSAEDVVPSESDQVCDLSNPQDCFPAVFIPTLAFQRIREGQSIPPGLHIRLNVQTGEKEARLNVPLVGEDDGASAKLSVGSVLAEVSQPVHEVDHVAMGAEHQAEGVEDGVSDGDSGSQTGIMLSDALKDEL